MIPPVRGYTRTENTRHRTVGQLALVKRHLGRENLLILRTPGNAAVEEFHEVQEFENSRAFFYETDEGVRENNKDVLLLPESILNAPASLPDLGYQGIWFDWDGTQTTTLIARDYYVKLDFALALLFARFQARKLMVSITCSRRDVQGLASSDEGLQKLQKLLATHAVDNCNFFTYMTTFYSSGTRHPGKLSTGGSPMVVLDALYTKR